MMSKVNCAVVAGVLLVISAGYGRSQVAPDSNGRALSLDARRQKELSEDAAKLLTLANELKAELDKSSKDTLSLSVVKKAEEVEKLARKVKEEMKRSLAN